MMIGIELSVSESQLYTTSSSPHPFRPFSINLRALLIIWLVVLAAVGPLLLRAISPLNAETGVHILPLHPVTFSLLAELSKLLVLIIGGFFYSLATGWTPKRPSWRSIGYISIPAAIYVGNNALKVGVMQYLDPAFFMLVNQLSILSTAFLFRIILKRKLTWLQYLALGMLLAGMTVSKIGVLLVKSDNTDPMLALQHHILVLGLILAGIAALTSSTADVAVEFCFKHLDTGLFEQNIILYLMGSIFNIIALASIYHDSEVLKEEYAKVMFLGPVAWTMITVSVVSGFTIALALKYLNNITKIFTSAGAIVLVTIFDAVVFGQAISSATVFGTLIVIGAISLYLHQRTAAAQLNNVDEAPALQPELHEAEDAGDQFSFALAPEQDNIEVELVYPDSEPQLLHYS